jgi:predicted DNA-binding WGR domain protein
VRRKLWRFSEREHLIEYYKISTIQELMKMFPDRTADSINSEIKRLKAASKLEGYKDKETVNRSLKQR